MDSLRDLLSKGKPVIVASSNDGALWITIGADVYLYWIDAAFHAGLKKGSLKNPWKTLNFIKKRCWAWKKES